MAVVSIVSKEILYRFTVRKAEEIRSSALKANAWHHRSDAISSIPVAVALALTWIFPNLGFIDRVGAIIVSLFILHAAWEIAKPALNDLADTSTSTGNMDEIKRIASSVPGALEIPVIRTRTSGNQLFVDMHLLVDPNMTVLEGHRIATEIKKRLLQNNTLFIRDVVVHIEP